MFKIIRVPTDGSPLSDKVVTAAVSFAAGNGGGIVALSVVEPITPVFEGGMIAGPIPAIMASGWASLRGRWSTR